MGINHLGKGYYKNLDKLYHSKYRKHKANRVYIYSYIEINDLWIPVYSAKPKHKQSYWGNAKVAKQRRDAKLKGETNNVN